MHITSELVDRLAFEYCATQSEIANLELKLSAKRDELITLTHQYGFPPPRSQKSKRLEGSSFAVTISYGQSIAANEPEVRKLSDDLPSLGAAARKLFPLLFIPETRYTLARGAHAAITGLAGAAPAELHQRFLAAITIRDIGPTLKITEKASGKKPAAQTGSVLKKKALA